MSGIRTGRGAMRNRVGLLLVWICLASAAYAQNSQNSQNRGTPVRVVKTSVAHVYAEVPLSGSVNARRISRLSPKVNGLITEVLVDAGDEVKQGDLLLRLDTVMADIELARARAELDEAKAKSREALRRRDEAEELVKKRHLPATNYAAARAEVEIKAASAQRLQEQLRWQKELLNRHDVYAPFDGVIAQKFVETGQWVSTGIAVLELIEMDTLRIDVPVPQQYFSHIQAGMPARIRFDALPEQFFQAKVSIKIPISDEKARTFPIRIEVDNRERLIAPGMSARAYIQLGEADAAEALLLPRDAIIKKADGTESVWIVGEEDGVHKATAVVVRTGRTYRGNIEIISGDLRAGDRVVVRGNEILRPGQTVSITEEIELQL